MIYAADIPSAVQLPEAERLAVLMAGRRVLEVGSEFGRSTIALASVATCVHAVDWHRGDVGSGFKDSLPSFLANLTRYGVRDAVIVHLGRSQDVLPVFAGGAFGGAFIDGDHEARAVLADLHQAAHVVVPGGPIVLHDGDQPQVRAAAEEFAVLYGVPLVAAVGTLLELVAPETAVNSGAATCRRGGRAR